MAIRIICPGCKVANAVDEEKRGRKVRCRKCDMPMLVPAAKPTKKSNEESAVQTSRKIAVKGAARRQDEEDSEADDRPKMKQKKKQAATPKKGLSVVALALGGGALLCCLLAIGGASLAAVFYANRDSEQVAELKNDKAPADPNKDKKPGAIVDPNKDKKPEGNVDPNKDKKPEGKVDPNKDKKPDNTNPDQGKGKEKDKKPDDTDPDQSKKKDIPKEGPIVENKPKALPDDMTPATVKLAKQATVYLRVTRPGGQVAEGSGFLAIQPGVIVTNAHVVGMLQASSGVPEQVEVVLHSGEPNERKLTGQVLGVDRECDLAIVRIPTEPPLPSPLVIESEHVPFETQRLYIFGFPFGAKLGKEITVSPSAISSLRKDKSGSLEQIQVNGGMHPGNSGGPVVNTRGHLVGVCDAVIENLTNGKKLGYSLLVPHMIERYGFYEGKGTSYRVEPADALAVFPFLTAKK